MTDEEVRHATRDLLLSNVKEGYSSLLGRHYCYIAPSPYYDPSTGAGHGARDFTWSGLLVDMK